MGLNDIHSLSHTKWNCKYRIVFAPKYRRMVFDKEKRKGIGKILRQLCEWKGYYVNTVGKNTSRIAEYIKNQMKEDKLSEQLTMGDYEPFKGGK